MHVSYTKIFRQEAKFIAGVAQTHQFPQLILPQFAFIGRSNVGKSSLINKLCNRRSLARVSHTPGRTQQINFFSVIDKFLLVDLPGYGFAKVSAMQRAQWQKLIMYYLRYSTKLLVVNILIDSRRGIAEQDITMMQLLADIGQQFKIILTKADKVKNTALIIAAARARLATLCFESEVMLTSSREGYGIGEIQNAIMRSLMTQDR